jgi:hypothetical protein
MMRYRSSPFGKALPAVLGLFSYALSPAATSTFGLAGFAVVAPAYAQTRDPIVTSDTPEYCGVLMSRITGITRATAQPPPMEAALLSEEGERMCIHGQTRGGILRLRRALEIILHGDD